MHSPEWHEERRKGIGGSDATIIMSGDEDRIIRLWNEKRGLVEPENLDDVLPVQMGVWTEQLNVFWFQKQTGKLVISRNDTRVSEEHPWMRCNLDGEVDE